MPSHRLEHLGGRDHRFALAVRPAHHVFLYHSDFGDWHFDTEVTARDHQSVGCPRISSRLSRARARSILAIRNGW